MKYYINDTQTEKAINKLYRHLGFANHWDEDLYNDYLVLMEGRDGRDYMVYSDEHTDGAIDIGTLRLVDEEDELEHLFY